MRRIGILAALVGTSVSFGCRCPSPCLPANQAKLVIVKGSVTTTANNGPGNVINIDVGGGAALPFSKIKRYTVTIEIGPLSTAPAGVDEIDVIAGVLKGAIATDVRVIRQDPANASPLPYPGMTVAPYTGTNSYIKVLRGADGLGPVEVQFNAYVEVEP